MLERPELAALIGAVAAEWGDIDNILGEIFNLVSLARPIPVEAHTHSELAAAIFDTLVAFPARIEVITSVMRLRLSREMVGEFELICSEIRRKSKIRNELIHASWLVCDKFPNDLVRTINGKWIRYLKQDFQENLEISVAIRNKLNDYAIKVAHSKKTDVQ